MKTFRHFLRGINSMQRGPIDSSEHWKVREEIAKAGRERAKLKEDRATQRYNEARKVKL